MVSFDSQMHKLRSQEEAVTKQSVIYKCAHLAGTIGEKEISPAGMKGEYLKTTI